MLPSGASGETGPSGYKGSLRGFVNRKGVDTLKVKYSVVLERNENGGYTVFVPALPGCISEGATIEEALVNIREAIEGYIEALKDLGKPIPLEFPVEVEITDEAA